MQIMFEVDAHELNERLDRARTILTEDNMEKVVVRTYRRTEGHIRRVLGKDIPPKYYVTPTEVRSAVQHGRISGRSLTVPVVGPKRSLGGGGFKIHGEHKGWNPPKYKITARIVKSGISTLPARAGSYGGNPPFNNTAATGYVNGHAFTRAAGVGMPPNNYPIKKMKGIAIPQMPTNRSRPEVESDIMSYVMKRVEHEIQNEMRKI